MHNLKEIISNGAFLVDVRTPAEFEDGHVEQSVNIPLDTIEQNLAMFQNKNQIVVFCRSGNRSGQAKMILEDNGFTNVINGGTWLMVNEAIG
jgi:rhodanese-related sulfurtransferase